jgi:hypothetical protein
MTQRSAAAHFTDTMGGRCRDRETCDALHQTDSAFFRLLQRRPGNVGPSRCSRAALGPDAADETTIAFHQVRQRLIQDVVRGELLVMHHNGETRTLLREPLDTESVRLSQFGSAVRGSALSRRQLARSIGPERVWDQDLMPYYGQIAGTDAAGAEER